MARNLDALLTKAAEVVAFHVGGLAEDGLEIPRFRSLSELRGDPTFQEDSQGAMLVLLDVDVPTRSVRVNITVDEGVLRRIDRAASAAGETRSGFLIAAAKARLQAAE